MNAWLVGPSLVHRHAIFLTSPPPILLLCCLLFLCVLCCVACTHPHLRPFVSPRRPQSNNINNHRKQAKRAEFEALQEEHEAQHKEISARGRMALADFLLGTSDMTSPTGGGRAGGLATVMEEGSPRGEFDLLLYVSIRPPPDFFSFFFLIPSILYHTRTYVRTYTSVYSFRISFDC